MKVSVIITTFQRTDFLIRAIDSVLNSDYSDFEIIVVDDNGLDNNYQIQNLENLKKYSQFKNFKYFANPVNSGACKARNQGSALASGEFLMFLDDDDYYYFNKISRQVHVLENSSFDACLCAMKRFDENNFEIVTIENFPNGQNLKDFLLNGNCFTSMIAIKKSSFIIINGFSEIDRFQDEFFMYKFFENNLKVFLLKEQLFAFSEHQNQRVSLGNINKISSAYKEIFDFKKKYFNLFSKKEQADLTNNYFLNLANIRSKGSFFQRIDGLKYLFKSNLTTKNNKILIKLIFSEQLVYFIKSKI